MDAHGMIDENQCALDKYYENAMDVEKKKNPRTPPTYEEPRLPGDAGFFAAGTSVSRPLSRMGRGPWDPSGMYAAVR